MRGRRQKGWAASAEQRGRTAEPPSRGRHRPRACITGSASTARWAGIAQGAEGGPSEPAQTGAGSRTGRGPSGPAQGGQGGHGERIPRAGLPSNAKGSGRSRSRLSVAKRLSQVRPETGRPSIGGKGNEVSAGPWHGGRAWRRLELRKVRSPSISFGGFHSKNRASQRAWPSSPPPALAAAAFAQTQTLQASELQLRQLMPIGSIASRGGPGLGLSPPFFMIQDLALLP